MSELARKLTQLNPAVRTRVLIIDVERLDGITTQHWWDRGDLKNRYVHYEKTIREPRTTIVCAKWYDSPDVIRLAEWDKGGRGLFLKRVHKLINEADVLVGHNIDNADVPWIKGDLFWPRIGHKHVPQLPPLVEPKTVDTLKELRRSFKSGVPFKSLDAVLKILGHDGKTDSYDPERMERAVAGSVEDQQRLIDYCDGDVIGTQWLYDWLRPHIKNHPALQVDGQESTTTCRSCGHETTPIARRWAAQMLSYSMRRCDHCGWHGRISFNPERMSTVRGV